MALPPDDRWRYELVEGRLVRMPLSEDEASRVTALLIIALGQFIEPGDLGAITRADGGGDLTQPGFGGQGATLPCCWRATCLGNLAQHRPVDVKRPGSSQPVLTARWGESPTDARCSTAGGSRARRWGRPPPKKDP